MSDIIIFAVGCFFSLIVAGAVALLFWGAANEPRGELFPSKQTRPPSPRSDPAAHAPSGDVEARNLM